jgi:type IV pilus assembly protein PilB
VFANNGTRNDYVSILEIRDKDNNLIEKTETRPYKVLPENVARLISDVLSDNQARSPAFGENSYLHFPGRDVAVKTGTTNDYRDAWIVGYTPRLAVGAWAGNNDNSPMEKKVAGFIIAPLWNEFMQVVLASSSPEDRFIEPEEKDVVVRYRIDGILYPVMTLDKSIQAGISARIKILCNLKVDEHRLPQDGRFKLSSEKYRVSFRVSLIPTFDGEKIVIRLLDEKAQVLSLEGLGMQPKSLEMMKRNISKPHGMILVTGPTGSGKTTTLYTVLNILNTPKVNISTIEDPIEYRIPHVNQSQISPKIGFTFDSGLRALLRQDPNIIMVGEIRDEETAKTAVHAAMTGHLLLSTLHTNDTITTLPRLSQMGIPSFLIASTTNLIISQRLVRKICPFCKEEYKLTKKAIEDLEKQLDVSGILSRLEKEGAIKSKDNLETLSFFRGKGCKKCNTSGYKGRVGVYETLEMTPALSEVILRDSNIASIEEEAGKQDMIKMVEDGFLKAVAGSTTLEEVMRVTKE